VGFRRTRDVQPSRTRIVRVASEAEMLASFHRTTRYNIGYAERSHVTVDEGAEADELTLHVGASAARAGVNMPGRDYFEVLLEQLPLSRTFVARHGGESLCALLIAAHDRRAYYLYSGSSSRMRNLKAMDLAMWRAMQYAARIGCRDYDLWGIAPVDDPLHPWHGFSEFKRGFGGDVVTYAGTWDITLSPTGRVALAARERALATYRRMRLQVSSRRAVLQQLRPVRLPPRL
jgi:lipid II:glycine glycyltransferase (peptidoglycan interpeptide bridge formation enzyme)